MPSEYRQKLSRTDINAKAEEVLLHFDSRAFERKTSPIYQVVDGLNQKYQIPFRFAQDLGFSPRGKKSWDGLIFNRAKFQSIKYCRMIRLGFDGRYVMKSATWCCIVK